MGQMTGSVRSIKYQAIDELEVAAVNPKRHDIDKLRASVKHHGFVEPMVVDERTGRLVAGHGRLETLKAMRDAGLEPPEGIKVDGDKWFAPVLRGWASDNDAQASAYLVASNRLVEAGGWDESALAELLNEINSDGYLEASGHDELTLAEVLKEANALANPNEGMTDPDEIPEADSVVVATGDMFLLGAHRLLCGDSTSSVDVDRVMGGEVADCVWTDPPYGVEYSSRAGTVHNDDTDGLPALISSAMASCFRVMKPGALIYVAHPAGANAMVFYAALRSSGFAIKQSLVWVKDSMVLGHADYHYQHEPIIYAVKPTACGRIGRGGKGWYGDNSQVSIFNIPRPKRSEDHPTMKPVELVEVMLKNSTAGRHVVFEPFSGSGTTIMACERLGRQCRAIELCPKYVAKTVARWERYTGQKAKLLANE